MKERKERGNRALHGRSRRCLAVARGFCDARGSAAPSDPPSAPGERASRHPPPQAAQGRGPGPSRARRSIPRRRCFLPAQGRKASSGGDRGAGERAAVDVEAGDGSARGADETNTRRRSDPGGSPTPSPAFENAVRERAASEESPGTVEAAAVDAEASPVGGVQAGISAVQSRREDCAPGRDGKETLPRVVPGERVTRIPVPPASFPASFPASS